MMYPNYVEVSEYHFICVGNFKSAQDSGRYIFEYFSNLTLCKGDMHGLTLTVLVATIDAQWEGMGDVGSAR